MPAPALAVGDGALGFPWPATCACSPGAGRTGWGALREVYPETREQRCWVHKIANVLDKMPRRLQARAKAMLHEIMRAPDRQSAEEDLLRFREEFEARGSNAW